jgi:hypothetical protein
MTATASALDDATLARMRAEAEAERSPFIDPRVFRQAQTALARVGAEWLSRIAGRPVTGWAQLANHELIVAVRAAEADAGYFQGLRAEQDAIRAEAGRVSRAEADAAAAEERRAWEDLRARLPVLVDVMHNWTHQHYDGYELGADHIVALAGFDVGRLHRATGQPLCWTPSRAHELRYVFSNIGDEKRLPNCRACLRHAHRLAGSERNRENGLLPAAPPPTRWWLLNLEKDMRPSDDLVCAPNRRQAIAQYRANMIIYFSAHETKTYAAERVRYLNPVIIDGPLTTQEAFNYAVGWAWAWAITRREETTGPVQPLTPATREYAEQQLGPELARQVEQNTRAAYPAERTGA